MALAAGGLLMALASYSEVRAALRVAADVLGHPTKDGRYGASTGTVVFREGGEVGGSFDGRYLVARGVDHEESAIALAHALGLQVWHKTDAIPGKQPQFKQATIPDLGVQVDEVDAGHFWLFCLPEGYTLPEG